MDKVNNLMQLKKAQLEAAAEHWNVPGDTKREIVDGLHEKDVSLADYYEVFGEKEEKAPKAKTATEAFDEGSDQVVVKMLRGNATYETHGFSFTREHPFVLMKRWQAAILLSEEEGFRIASTDEVEQYYL